MNKKKTIILIIIILLIATGTYAITNIKKIIKETDDYIIREATLDNKKGYHFEIKNKEGVLANQLVNVVFGVWLNQSYGLQIVALGSASAVIGFAELIGEGGVSLISDGLTKRKAVFIGIIGCIISSLILPFLGRTIWGAYIGLFLFYLTFEFTIVSGIPMMTGILPSAVGPTFNSRFPPLLTISISSCISFLDEL